MSNASILLRCKTFRDCGAVKRFHVVRTLRDQTVGEHSHGVAVLVMQVSPACSSTLLKAALTHDFHERSTGDMPSTAKWLYPELAIAMHAAEEDWNRKNGTNWKLTAEEESILRYCDYLELLFWSLEEFELGNSFAVELITNISRVLDDIEPPNAEAAKLYRYLRIEVLNAKEER